MAGGSTTFTARISVITDVGDAVNNIKNIQNALNGIKLPDTIKTSLGEKFKSFYKEAEKYQDILARGPKTKGDAGALERSGEKVLKIYESIAKEIDSIDDKTLKNAFKDMGGAEVERLKGQLESVKTALSDMAKNSEFGQNLKTEFEKAQSAVADLKDGASDLMSKLKNSTFKTFSKNFTEGRFDLAAKNIQSIKEQINGLEESAGKKELLNWIEQVESGFNELKNNNGAESLIQQMNELKGQLSGAAAQAVEKLIEDFQNMATATNGSTDALRRYLEEQERAGKSAAQLNTELAQVKNRITYFLGLANAVNLFKRAIRSAFNTVKELDKVMTETAVVTNFSVSDMWKQLPEYTKRANQLGVTTKAAYESATLYYQQGLNTNQVAAVSVETLKMARIAGLDAAEATDRMTNALRGFNMEINATSAQKVDDVYSKLAAITASNVDEISTAMTKVASLASNANMDFETTSAFLAKIIETTRESAETAGTALKTVIARFSEVKNLYSENQLKGTDEEGQVIDVNKISKALRTAGIDLNKYFLGEVGLDDIFMELAEKWDSLTNVQQRYIATQAAGSRQQSRFIALMQDYARTQELVKQAYNSNGASAKQFEKTQESLESKLARLKNAWNEFLMGIANSTIIKGAVDLLTGLLNVLNKITGAFGPTIGGFLKLATAIGALTGVKKFINSKMFSNFLGKVGNSNIGKFFGWKNPLGDKDNASQTAKTSWIKAAREVVAAWLKGEKQVEAAAVKGEKTEEAAATKGEKVEEAAALQQEEVEGTAAVVNEEAEGTAAVVNEEAEGIAGVVNEEVEGTAAVVNEEAEGIAGVAGEEGELTAAISGEMAEAAAGAAKNLAGTGTRVITGVGEAGLLTMSGQTAGILGSFGTAVGGAAAGAGTVATTAPLVVSSQTAGILASFGGGAAASGGAAAAAGGGAAAAGGAAAGAGLSAAAATGIGAIIIALIAAITYGIYDQYKKSAVGQLKTATKMKDSLEKINQDTQNTTEDTKNKIEQYNSLTEKVNKATDVREKKKAVSERNDFVNQMVQEDSRYAQYSKAQYDRNGNLILSLDDDFIRNYDRIAEQAISTAQINNDLASAVVAKKQIRKYNQDLTDINLESKTKTYRNVSGYNQATHDEIRDLSEEDVAKYTQIALDRDKQQKVYEESTKAAYQSMLKNSDLNEDVSELTAEALAKNFDADEFFDKVDKKQTENWWAGKATKEELRKLYKELYGVDADRNLTREELRDAVSYAQVQQEEQQKADEFAKLIDSNENYNSLLKIYNGQFDNDVGQFKTQDIYDNLIKGTNLTGDQLEAFATALGITTDQLEATIQANIDLQKKIEQQKIGKLAVLGKRQGIDQNKIANLIETLDTKQIEQLLGISDTAQALLKDNFKNFLENEDLFNEQNFDKVINFFSGIDLDNPLQALSKLNKLAESTDPNIRKLASDIKEINKSTLFDTGNLTQAFMMSGAYESISESLQDLIKENDKISADNIRELAESCSDLKILLENTTLESDKMAQALARAFTVVESGKANIEGITTAILEALGNTITSTTAIDKYFKEIDDFDAGRDYDKGKEFINTGLESLKESAENYEFGSETFKKYYETIFGKKAFEQFQKLSLDDKQTNLQNNIDRVTKLLDNDALEAVRQLAKNGKLGITSLNEENTQFSWDTNLTFDEAVQKIQDELQVSESTAAAILLQMGKHMDGLFDQFDENAYQKDIQKLAESLKEQKVLTEEELKILAESYGKTVEEIYGDLKTQFGEGAELPVQIKWYDDDGTLLSGEKLTEKFNFDKKTGTVTIIDANNKSQKITDDNLSNYFTDFSTWGQQTYKNWEHISPSAASQINTNIFGGKDYFIDADEILSYLTSTYKLSSAQATEVANSIAKENNGLFSKTIQIPKIENGEYVVSEITLTDESIEGLNKKIEAQEKNADWEGMASAIGAAIASQLENLQLTPTVENPDSTNIAAVRQAIIDGLSGISVAVTYTPVPASTETGTGGVYNSDIDQRPSYMRGHAKGGDISSPGTALVGEEGPELVWNKEGGYTYLAGKNGPEFRQLNPGDQIFPADETKLILNRDVHPALASGGKILSSYGNGSEGTWSPPPDENGGSSGSGKKKSDIDLDKYYNLVEDTNELLRLRNLLETQYNRLLEGEYKSGKLIYDNLKQQLKLLEERKKITEYLAEKRKQQLLDLVEENKEYQQYVWWNDADQTIEIDWDAINALKEDKQKEVTEYLSKLEDMQSQYDDMIEQLEDIEDEIQDIKKRGRDEYISLEERLRDALIAKIQEQIDELSATSEAIDTANSNLMDAIQKTIDKQRQERENAKTEEDLAKKEQRLAYLRQDSSGANAVEIAQLEKELDEARENYTDQLIDQKISELQEQNDEAAQQRQEQIDLMQQSLDWQEKNGEFWEQAYQILEQGIGPDGSLLKGSELEQLLKSSEGWQGLSDAAKMKWLEELETQVAQAVGYLSLSRQLEDIGTKAGTEITFTDAEGNSHTGKVDKNGNVVVTNDDGTTTTWKNVYQNYDGKYHTLESEEDAETEDKPITSTQQPQQPAQSQKVRYEYKYTGFDYTQHKKYRRIKGSNDSWDYIGLENHDGATSCSKCGWKKPSGGGGGGCFAAGTKIIMSDFTTKNIEDILVGDEVIAYNEEKELFEPKKVTKSYAHYNTPRVIKVILSNNVILKITPGHPILTTEGWKSRDIENSLYEHNTVATWLNIGDQIIGYSGLTIVKDILEMEIPNNYVTYNIEVEICHTYLADGIVVHNGKTNTVMLYATGGLNTETGPAWLDGTKSHPELVLNARDTENFIQLKDHLATLRQMSTNGLLGAGGDNYYDIKVQVDSLGSDYDVDMAIDRIKARIYQDGAYRNVNTLNRLR